MRCRSQITNPIIESDIGHRVMLNTLAVRKSFINVMSEEREEARELKVEMAEFHGVNTNC